MSELGKQLKSSCDKVREKIIKTETELNNYEKDLIEFENYIIEQGFIFNVIENPFDDIRLSSNATLTLPNSLYKLHFIYTLANGIPYMRLIGISGQSSNRRYPVTLESIKRNVLNLKFGPSRHRITVNNKEDNLIFFDLFKTILSANKPEDYQSIINIMKILEQNENVEKLLKTV